MLTQLRFAMTSAALFAAFPAQAASPVDQSSSSGNLLVEFGLIGLALVVVVLLALGALSLEKRNANLGRDRDDDGSGWGMF